LPPELNRQRLIQFAQERASESADPVNPGIDLARIAVARLGLVEKGDAWDRRPAQDELDRLIAAD
jgi:hypothetical protein